MARAFALVLWLVSVGAGGVATQARAGDKITDKTAKVVVEEYLSLTCSHCANFHREVYPRLAEGILKDVGVVFVYRDYPLDRLALQAAVLARCGGDALRNKLMGAMLDRQQEWMRVPDPQGALFAIVRLVGIDRTRAQACLQDADLERAVLEEQLAGQKRYKISSTPTLVVAGEKVGGALNEKKIERAINKALQENLGR